MTTVRLLLVIPYVLFLSTGDRFMAGITYIIALITDIDGTVARHMQATSSFGSFYDPAVDATFMVIAFGVLVKSGSILLLPVVIYLCATLFRLLPALLYFKRVKKVRTTLLSKTIAFSGYTSVLLATFAVSTIVTTTLLLVGATAHIILGAVWFRR